MTPYKLRPYMKLCVLESRSRWGRRGWGWGKVVGEYVKRGARFGSLQRPEAPDPSCPWHREKGNTALPVPSSPGQEICVQGAKEKCPGRQQRLRGLGGGGARLQPAPKGSPGDSRLEARRHDSDRGSWEEEPEVAAGGSGPVEGRARSGSGRGWRREVALAPGAGERA